MAKMTLLTQAYKLTTSWKLAQILKSCAQSCSEGVKGLQRKLKSREKIKVQSWVRIKFRDEKKFKLNVVNDKRNSSCANKN